MKISIVSVCVNYSDEIAYTYKYNQEVYHKHNYWIITTPEDYKTIDFCLANSISYYTTRAFYDNNAMFNKARSINALFRDKKEVLDNEWILLTDSDMICANVLKYWIDNPDNYDCMRIKDALYSGHREFILDDGSIKKPLTTDKFYGFFQLFHKSHIEHKIEQGFLPEHNDASFYDYLFKISFNKHILIEPENINLIHVGTPGKYHQGKKV